jgi:hypothetical protein
MIPARSLLASFRRPLLREIGLQLGLLAVVLQIGLTVLHVAPTFAGVIGGPALESAWCGTTDHEPAVPAATHARDVCPLCQLPPLGPVPPALADACVPVAWEAAPVRYFHETTAIEPVGFARPIQPRGPPPSA